MNLCKDCRHARQPFEEVNAWLCYHPAAIIRRLDPVTGEKAIADECRHQRQHGACGMEAKNFEPIERSEGFR